MFDALEEVLEPFAAKDWLTYVENEKLHTRPLTVVGTGNTPLHRVVQVPSRRYVFYDAPLVELTKMYRLPDGTQGHWDSSFAPIASSKWHWSSYYPNVGALRKYSKEAHDRGIKARWWGAARWPALLRRALWDLQLRADVDWLNTDDLSE